MNQRQLMYFLEVYKNKSISKAAEKLYISPQAISKTITSLEDELGVSLFIHDSNKIVPTKDAATLSTHAKKILSEYDIIENHIFSAEKIISPLQVSCSYDTGLMLGTAFFTEFIKKHPDIRVQLRESLDFKIKNQLENGKIELALITSVMNSDKYECIPIFTDKFCLIAHKSHPLAKLDKVALSDLDGMNLICRDTSSDNSRHHFSILSENNTSINIPIESTNSRFLTELVIENAGVAMLVSSLTRYIHNPDVRVIPFIDKHLTKHIFLAYKKDAVLSEEARIFRDEITAYF